MRTLNWLQISDFHLREIQAWEQDVVLSAMCKDIERRSKDIGPIDFVLATGDIAFGGQPEEYERANAFFDKVVHVTGVPQERIYCIPGNHDVNRNRQKTCFAGARHILQSENEIDSFLGDQEEVATLLQRQQHYHQFQNAYFTEQKRQWTSDRLAYVSELTLENLQIAIVGFNTAWLAHGGLDDHGKLLMGERQVIEALRIVDDIDPHVVVAMGHHPFQLLNEFDRRVVQRRIEERCGFYHCGHLHDPDSHDVVRSGGHCLTVAAGAAFESRHTHNAYSVVSLDVMQGQRRVKTIQYKPTDGTFSYESKKTFALVIDAAHQCSLKELGDAIEAYRPSLSDVANYLAALLLDMQAEVPITAGSFYAFGSYDVLQDLQTDELKSATTAFMAVRNPLRLLAAQMPLADLLSRYGTVIEAYGNLLIERSQTQQGLRERLVERNADARALAGAEPLQPYTHTLSLLREMAGAQDWDALRIQAERLLGSPEGRVVTEARRMLALSLAHSPDSADKEQSDNLYRDLIREELATAADFAALASLLIGIDEHGKAKEVVLNGIERFPDAIETYAAIGQQIIEATGDHTFRDQLRALRAGRGKA